MSKKVRIHELAKQYGMSGKDLAAKLRDCGFTKAKSHMSALDEFEVVTAQGVLEANGVVPTSSTTPAASSTGGSDVGGGLIVRKKKRKKKVVEEAPAEPPATPPSDDAAAAASPDEDLPTPKRVKKKATPTAAETLAEELETQPSADSSQAAEIAPALPAETGVAATRDEVVSDLPDLPELLEDSAEALADAEPIPTAEAVDAPSGEAEDLIGQTGQTEQEGDDKQGDGPKPKGNVVGFIDPTSFQTQRPERRRNESRRLQSSDDVTPDVRPTFSGRGRAGTGPRGNLTATQLREREQGRFLRRNRTGGSSGPGGRRGGGGRGGARVMVTESPLRGQKVRIEEPITMSKLAETLKLKSGVILKMAMEKKYGMFTLNSVMDQDTALLLATEYEVELEVEREVTAEQAHLEDVKKKRSTIEDSELVDRAPTVAFLGHVDHGKTTLIDRIRSTQVAEGEAGGITQHIGAYQVTLQSGHPLTIIDTPGHAAFTSMRARGANAVDVVVLVVAGDDGVKPSTEEAINHARAAGTPIVVAINKKDKTGFNANQTIQQLMGHELVPEQYGGNTAMFEVSALNGEGIDEMLEHIFLMAEAELGLKAHPKGPASGVVLEAEIQQGRGIVAHLLVQDGTLVKGDVILAGEGYGKVKSIQNDRGKIVREASPSTPVMVTGLDALPGVGSLFFVIETLAKAKEIALERERKNRVVELASKRSPAKELEAILGKSPKQEIETINLLVRADVQGSVEVIKHEVAKLTHDEVDVKLVHSGVGPITESDVALAATSGALLVAFHVGVVGKARQEAERNKLEIRRYDVIYEFLDDMRLLMEGALAPELQEEITGHVEIRRLFKSSKVGLIAGCMVLDGTVSRNSKVRLLRDDTVVYSGELASLRREKEEAKEVREGFECGIVLRDFRDIREGDIIETYSVHAVKRTLDA